MASEILVVSQDDTNRACVLQILAEAGYQTRGASTFEEGKRLLATTTPDLLIADERLGDFNGLHLILRGRANHPDMAAIVTTGTRIKGLEIDARGLEIDCLVKPADARDWLQPVSQALATTAARRRTLQIAS
ncbi:MAG TPA: response regulator [Vicinamibacterales bacterium]|jgi:DNA-binding NtrC family response regulator|nr:response regulator [Vicinamibacterales bacterium]